MYTFERAPGRSSSGSCCLDAPRGVHLHPHFPGSVVVALSLLVGVAVVVHVEISVVLYATSKFRRTDVRVGCWKSKPPLRTPQATF